MKRAAATAYIRVQSSTMKQYIFLVMKG